MVAAPSVTAWDCPLPLYQLDAGGGIVAINPAMSELLGWKGDLSAVASPVRLPDGGAGLADRRLWRVPQASARVLSVTERRDSAGAIWGVVVSGDLSAPASSPEAATGTQRDEEFLALAHDLRSPLNSILGFSDVLLHSSGTELGRDALTAVHHIAAAGERLLLSLDGLFDLARLRLGRLELRAGPMQPQAVWAQVEQLLAEDLRLRGVVLETHAPAAGQLPTMDLDTQRLQQLLAYSLSWMLRAASPTHGLRVSWDLDPQAGWTWRLDGPCPRAFEQDRLGTNAITRTLCHLLAKKLGGTFTLRTAEQGLGSMMVQFPTGDRAL